VSREGPDERASGDKKTPAGVIMITAVQRKTEYCGRTRMAAVGSWEIGILERHFRVAGSCRYQLATADHQQRCFPIVGPLAFRPAPLSSSQLDLVTYFRPLTNSPAT
jgi:hypothetical protein